jgi:molecular chaperone HtpG
VLDRLEEMAQGAPDDYLSFFRTFGVMLKEGVAVDEASRERLAPLLRWESTREGAELGSFAEYIARMPEGQPAVYYAIGESLSQLRGSPYLESLRKKGYEVLLMTDPVDEWVVDALREVEWKPLVSAMRANLDLGDAAEKEKTQEEAKEKRPLFDRMKEILKDRVSEVRPSSRLTDTPCVLVVPEGAHHAQMEQLLRAAGRPSFAPKRILEVNASHPLVDALKGLAERDDAALGDYVETLYDQAVLMEGGRIADPNSFARRLTSLLERAVRT